MTTVRPGKRHGRGFMHHNKMPDLATLTEILDYDPESGWFTWKQSRRGVSQGCRAGSLHKSTGYRSISCAGGIWRENRLAWLFMTGEDPGESEIDHKNRVRDDNRWVNLRKICRSVNTLNTGTRGNSGVRGVWKKNDKYWGARLSYRGECILYRQDFASLEEAVAARREAERKVGIRS